MSFAVRFINNLHRLTFGLSQVQKHGQVTCRLIHKSSSLQLRKVVEKTDGKVTTIEGLMIDSPRKDNLLELDGPKDMCPLCRLNMDINYTDIMVISQFVQEDGEIVPRQITGLCYPQHSRMKKLIHQAHSAGLMQHLRPHVFPEEYSHQSDHAWKKYNVYYNEAVDN